MIQLSLTHDRYFYFVEAMIKEKLNYQLHPEGDVTVYFKTPGDELIFLLKYS